MIQNIGLPEIIVLSVLLVSAGCIIMTIALVILDIRSKRLDILSGIVVLVATLLVIGPLGLVLYLFIRARNRRESN